MEHRWIEEHRIIERYVTGRLTADEEERFEEHYLDCPECLDRLEEADALRRGLARTAAEDAARSGPAAPARRRGGLGSLGGLRGPRLAAAAVVAAALLAGLATPTLLLQRRVGELETALDDALRPRAGTPVLRLGPERSTGGGAPDAPPSRRLTLDGDGWAVLSLDAPRTADGRAAGVFRVTLEGPAGQSVWSDGSVVPDARGRVIVALPFRLLEPGVQTIRLEPDPTSGDSTGSPAVYRFDVRRPER